MPSVDQWKKPIHTKAELISRARRLDATLQSGKIRAPYSSHVRAANARFIDSLQSAPDGTICELRAGLAQRGLQLRSRSRAGNVAYCAGLIGLAAGLAASSAGLGVALGLVYGGLAVGAIGAIVSENSEAGMKSDDALLESLAEWDVAQTTSGPAACADHRSRGE